MRHIFNVRRYSHQYWYTLTTIFTVVQRCGKATRACRSPRDSQHFNWIGRRCVCFVPPAIAVFSYRSLSGTFLPFVPFLEYMHFSLTGTILTFIGLQARLQLQLMSLVLLFLLLVVFLVVALLDFVARKNSTISIVCPAQSAGCHATIFQDGFEWSGLLSLIQYYFLSFSIVFAAHRLEKYELSVHTFTLYSRGHLNAFSVEAKKSIKPEYVTTHRLHDLHMLHQIINKPKAIWIHPIKMGYEVRARDPNEYTRMFVSRSLSRISFLHTADYYTLTIYAKRAYLAN